MTLATDIAGDLVNMLDDWGDSITIAATDYDGIYEQDFADSLDQVGYQPVFILAAADVSTSSVAVGDSVSVTSVISNLAAAGFTVRSIEPMGEGLSRLVLEAA